MPRRKRPAQDGGTRASDAVRSLVLAGAILFRPLSAFQDDLRIRLDGMPVLIIEGGEDRPRLPGEGLLQHCSLSIHDINETATLAHVVACAPWLDL